MSPDLHKRFTSFVTSFGPYITVFGLVFSLWQAYKSDRSRKALDEISNSISTKYVDVFPGELPQLSNLVGHAERTLHIVVDYVTYGDWSNPSGFDKYKRELLAARRRGVVVDFLVYDPHSVVPHRDNQFKTNDEAFTALQKSDAWREYVKFYPNKLKAQNMAEFDRFLDTEQSKNEEELHNTGITISPRHGPFPMFFWIRDGQEAIFVFYSFNTVDSTKPNRSVAFRTVDPEFIQLMERMYTDVLESRSDSNFQPKSSIFVIKPRG